METTEQTVCIDCQMAKILEPGKPTSAIDSSHAQCVGTREEPCRCGCAYSLGKACKRCGRSGSALASSLDRQGNCSDESECLQFVVERQRKRAAERAARMAANPAKRRGGSGGGFPVQRASAENKTSTVKDPSGKTCLCGCGETTKSWFRPGHDMRFISSLATAVKSGTMSEADAVAEVAHSDALVAKLRKRLG